MNKFGPKNYLYIAPWLLMLFLVTFSKNNPAQYAGLVEQDGLGKALIVFTYTVSLILLFINLKAVISILKGRWLYVFFLLYVTASAVWSDDVESTLRVAAYFWGGAIICLMAVLSFRQNPAKLFQVLIFYSVLMIIGSLITVFVNPMRGIDDGGRWIGLTTHANILGVVSIISIWANTCYMSITKSKYIKIFNVLVILLSAVCLYGADSATSIVLSLLIVGLTMVLRSLNLNRLTNLIAQLSVIVFFIILSMFVLYVVKPEIFRIEALFGAVGRNTTFTGRTELWEMAMIKIYQHPIIGYGFQEFIAVSGMKIKHFHNGYIELLIRGGAVAVMFVIAFAFQLIFSFKRISDHRLFIFFLIMILVILVHNVTEGSFGRGVTALWLVFSFIYFYKGNGDNAPKLGVENANFTR